MTRWDPDTRDRLQQAAMALFFERGFEAVTVAEIAERAGLTKRTFFRHFTDKRDVVFARAQALEDTVVLTLTATPAEVAPLRAVTAALTRGAALFTEYRQFAGAVRELVASSAELRERDLLKTASLAAALSRTLQGRGVEAQQAELTARTGTTIFTSAYDRWIDRGGEPEFADVVQECLDDLRAAVGTD